MKKKTPKIDSGSYKFRFHQSLTPEKWWELLKKVINTVETFASKSDNKDNSSFILTRNMDKKPFFSSDELGRLAKENYDIKQNQINPNGRYPILMIN